MCSVTGDKLFFKTASVEIAYKLRGTEHKRDEVSSKLCLFMFIYIAVMYKNLLLQVQVQQIDED